MVDSDDWRLGHAAQRAGASAERCDGHDYSSVVRGPPDVAFCIAGLARTITTPIVAALLRFNLIRAFSGSRSSRAFFVLKTDRTNESTAGVERVLHEQYLSTLLQEAVVLTGNGVTAGAVPPTTAGLGWSAPSHVVPAEANEWRRFRPDDCAENNASAKCCEYSAFLRGAGNVIRPGP